MLPEPVHLLSTDPATFEYLYTQCCNDIVHERYQPEIKYEVALRLSALRIFEHAVNKGFMASSKASSKAKVNLKRLEAECGLDHFVPASLYQSMKRKELFRVLATSIKLNSATLASSPGGQKKGRLTPLSCKLQFLKILSDLPCYGGKSYANNIKNCNKKFSSVSTSLQSSGVHERKKCANTKENGSSSDQTVELACIAIDSENNKTDTAKLAQTAKLASSSSSAHQGAQTASNHPLVNESTVLLSPKYGLSFLSNTAALAPVSVVRLEDVSMIKVTRNENSGTEMNVDIYGTPAQCSQLGSSHGSHSPTPQHQLHPNTNKSLKDWSLKEPLMQLSLDTADAQELVLLIKGYHQLLSEQGHHSSNSGPIKSGNSLATSSASAAKALSTSPLQVIWESSNDEWWNDGGKCDFCLF